MGHFPKGSRFVDSPGGRVLQFPVRTDPNGQVELFPEPEPPDPFSASQLVIHYTLLQMRVTRISTYLSPRERADLFAQYDALVSLFLAPLESAVAQRRAREAQSQISRSA